MTTDTMFEIGSAAEATPELAAPAASLTAEQKEDLSAMEAVIQAGQRTFLEVGRALMAIRDEQLFRDTHSSFEAYLADRWPEIGKRRAYQLIDAVEVAENVNHGSLPPIENERQARALTGLTPDQQREAWSAAAKQAGGTPNGAVVKAEVDKIKGVAPKPKPPTPAERLAPPIPTDRPTMPTPAPVALTPIAGSMPTPLPGLSPVAPSSALPTPLPGLSPAAPAIDQAALVQASVLAAYCDELASQARRRLAHLLAQAEQAGVAIPSLEIPGDAVRGAAITTLDGPTMRMQAGMLAMAVKVITE